MSPAEVIKRIADISEAVGWQAGVGGTETAGQVVSYLAAHPEHLDAFFEEGFFALPDRFWEHGRLTWHAANGRVVSPQQCRFARTIKKMEAGE